MSPPSLLTIPAELRLEVYSYILASARYDNPWHSLLLTCHQTNNEVVPLLYKDATLTLTLSRRSQVCAKLDYDSNPAHVSEPTLGPGNLAVIEDFAKYCECFQNVVINIEVDAYEKERKCSLGCGFACQTGRGLVHCFRIRRQKQEDINGQSSGVEPFGYIEPGYGARLLRPLMPCSDYIVAGLIAWYIKDKLPRTVWSSKRFELDVEWVFIESEDVGPEADDLVDNYEPDLWNRKPDHCFAMFARALRHKRDALRCSRWTQRLDDSTR